jgi:methyltransferase (TIGR00027 family)
MKAGSSSKTAEGVCAGRAIAHATTRVAAFSDPTALALLPPTERERVASFLANQPPRGLRERAWRRYQALLSHVMIARTVAIDDAIREAHAAQLVVLGAGLDGRAWRMPELAQTLVLEVDHPDTQREKRARIGSLVQQAREVRFVPVDFTRDSLDRALETAGHDATRPTTWVWEGVVMYLTPAQIESTLAVLERRSAIGSRLCVLYHRPALLLQVINAVVARLGEPLRSHQTAAQMRTLLARFGFSVVSDRDMSEIGASFGRGLGEALRSTRHLRLAIADRR